MNEESAAENMTVAELFALCGSASHESNDKDLNDLYNALGEPHPSVAGDLVEQLRRAIDRSEGTERGTAGGSEHPEWHKSLQRAMENTEEVYPDGS